MIPFIEQDGMTLYQADCLEALPGSHGAGAMIFDDPPFNLGKKYDGYKDKRLDYYSWCAEWIKAGYDALKPTGSFYLMTITRHLPELLPMMAKGHVFVNLISWRNVSAAQSKRNLWCSTQPIIFCGKTPAYNFNTYGDTRKQQERWGTWRTGPRGQLLDYWDDIPNVYTGSINHPEAILVPGSRAKLHPCQMPVRLAERMILISTNPGDLIVDLFAGVGAVAIAAQKHKRQYLGFETSMKYCEVIKNRIYPPALEVCGPARTK